MNQADDPSDAGAYYQRQHQEAVLKGEHWYIDAQTGFLVFTELYHQERGACCQSACRHCPFGYTP